MGNFDQYADSYQGVHGDNVRVTGENSEYFARYKARYVARLLGAQFSGKILDYGCGVGMVSSFLKQLFPKATVDGFDLSPASIANVNSAVRAQGIFTSEWNEVRHDYDAVVLSNVMHHVPPDKRLHVIESIRDRVAPGGILVIVEHNPLNPLTRWAVAHCAFDDDAILIPTSEAKNIVSHCGMRIVRRDYIVFFPRLLSWLRGLEQYLNWLPAGAQYALVARRTVDSPVEEESDGGHVSNSTDTVIHRREAAFHDIWASNTPDEDVLVREWFEAPTALENSFILSRMGSLRGKKLLDIGSGLGESSVYFALQGADVTAVDVSPLMIEKALSLGRKYGVELTGITSGAEDLNVPAGKFDFVYTANTIHHVENRPLLFEQMRRALKPGGMFFSFDPIAYNPVINIYRRMATEVRTRDESPLRMADLALAKRYFSRVGHREFWISALVLFAKYYLIDRIHPNQDRYWKRILRESPEDLRWWIPLRRVDRILTRIPIMRWLAWNMVLWGEKPL